MVDVSIVMPVYNGEKFLRESIDSIIRQTHKNWELILVNDCSTDESLKIMEDYAAIDSRIIIVTNDENKKLPKSLNIGFRKARGKFLTWTSDDNIYYKDSISVMYQFLKENNEYGMIYCDMWYIDANGKITGSVSKEVKELYYNDCVGACFMYRSEILETIGEYDPMMFLVEDYEYWLRINKIYEIYHLPQKLYFYRYHADSLTQTKGDMINRQLYHLRVKELDFLLKKISKEEKKLLFLDMWTQNKDDNIKDKFFPNNKIPDDLKWINEERNMDKNKKIILFGAGDFGKKALHYLGDERVAFFADNMQEKVGTIIERKEVISFASLKKMHSNYNIVIAVDARKASVLAKQLEDNEIHQYITYLELVNNLKKPQTNGYINWINSFNKAVEWIKKYTIMNEGIVNNSNEMKSYPEVTGYIIPTLMRWGYRETAIGYANWLCAIQKKDGSWYDTENKGPYVFDTAQVLKGLLAVLEVKPELENNIKRGCDWIISNIQEDGRLTTPISDAWNEAGVCSEAIHLYCLSPLIEAGKNFKVTEYIEASKKVANYYIMNEKFDILNFNLLSHFYAYIIEGLYDIGEIDLASEAMEKISVLQREDGMIPAFNNVNWVCSTGVFQFAVVWYKLGNIEKGNKALNYAVKLQNESGGWFGSYPTSDNPKGSDRNEYPDYFPTSEISWAVKYFLDAVYYKCKLEFEIQAPIFKDYLDKKDGRYQTILSEVKGNQVKRVCDVGCGKGRYIKNLTEDIPNIIIDAVDLSDNVMNGIDKSVRRKQGSLNQIPYNDETFDITYTVEALEHAITIENAIKEMLRVTKKGGKIIIIDKNMSAMGLLEIDEWEQWFNDELFVNLAKLNNCELSIVSNISYEDEISDGLFSAWILKK